MTSKRWKKRVIELSKIHGLFVRFLPEGDPPAGDPPAEPTSPVNSDGSFVENWHEKYGEENTATLSRFNNFDDFVNSHIATKKKFGKNPDTLVEIPTETSSDEVKTAWAKAHSVPETYEYKLSDELAIKLGPLDDKRMTTLREFAKTKNWSQADFKDVLDFYHNSMSGDIDTAGVANQEQQDASAAEGKAELKKKWLDGYDNRVLRANAVLRKFGGEEAVAEFNAQNSPKMIEFLDNIAESMSEDTLKGIGPSTGLTVANIDSQLADIRDDMNRIVKENPVNFKINSKYKDLVERKHILYKQKQVPA